MYPDNIHKNCSDTAEIDVCVCIPVFMSMLNDVSCGDVESLVNVVTCLALVAGIATIRLLFMSCMASSVKYRYVEETDTASCRRTFKEEEEAKEESETV